MLRDAVPGDARDLAVSQILAWRAAYRGILEPDQLADLDEEHLTTQWARNLESLPSGSRQLALSIEGVVVGWSGVGSPRKESEPGPGELKALNPGPEVWGRALRFYESHGWNAEETAKDAARFTPAFREPRYVSTL